MSVSSKSIMSAIRKINGTKDGNKEVGYWAGDKSGCIYGERQRGLYKRMNGELTVQYGVEEEKKSDVIMKMEDIPVQ